MPIVSALFSVSLAYAHPLLHSCHAFYQTVRDFQLGEEVLPSQRVSLLRSGGDDESYQLMVLPIGAGIDKFRSFRSVTVGELDTFINSAEWKMPLC